MEMTKEIRQLNVLIAEDSEDDLIFIMRELRRGGFEMSFRRVDNENDLAGAISACVWDLVIADYRMPLLSGLEVVRAVRTAGLEVPVIIVSGYMGEDFAVTAMQAGADDYILKDRLSRLPPAVERELREYETRRARRKAEEEILFLNRLLETILEVDKMVVRESCSGRVFSETCRILVEKAGFMMAWIGKADLDGGSITPVCHTGCAEGFFAALNGGAGGRPFGMGLAGAAVRTGRHAVCLDTETDETYAPWREAARAFGFRACASFPILADGTVFGNMNVYSSSPGSFAGKTIDLLESLAADIGFAL
jgi:FixJ family two-component response regulator